MAIFFLTAQFKSLRRILFIRSHFLSPLQDYELPCLSPTPLTLSAILTPEEQAPPIEVRPVCRPCKQALPTRFTP